MGAALKRMNVPIFVPRMDTIGWRNRHSADLWLDLGNHGLGKGVASTVSCAEF
jgi:hypothetical protein